MQPRRAPRALAAVIASLTAAVALVAAGPPARAQELAPATRQPLLSELLRSAVEDSSRARLHSVSMRAATAATPRPASSERATPAPSASATATSVRALRPRVLLDAPADEVVGLAEALNALSEVGAAAEVIRGTVPVAGASGPEAFTLAAVDPDRFRLVTPQTTAAAGAVWDRLREGDAVFTHEAAARLGLDLGGPVTVAEVELRVGALAATGVPSIADAVVSHDTADGLALDGQGSVLVAPADGVPLTTLNAAVAAATGLEPAPLGQPETRRAFLAGDDTRRAFEPFTYTDHGDGLITIDPDWVARNIVSARVPLLTGPVRCHRLLIDQLRGALAELEASGLGGLLDPRQYGGCHVARHIDFNPARPLSMHAWGLAVDLNVSTNGLGQPPQMDPRVVEVFERWGFTWGGRWSRPDGMHFELAALLEPVER